MPKIAKPSFQKIFLIAVFVASTLTVLSGTLSAKEITPLGKALNVLFNGAVSSDDRKVVAKGFEYFCRELNGKIPAPSPRENDWLDAEIKAGRVMEIYSSVEFAKRQSKRTLKECRQAAQILVRLRPEAKEDVFWSLLLGRILDDNLLDHIRNLKKTNAAKISEDDISTVSLFPTMAQLIVNEILTPSLMRGPRKK